MLKQSVFFIIFLFTIISNASEIGIETADRQKPATKVDEELFLGCSCSVGKGSGSFISTKGTLESGDAFIFVNGLQYRLKNQKSERSGAGKFISFYSNKVFDLKLSCTEKIVKITAPCQDSCSETDFTCNAEFKKGILKENFENLTGECGC